MSRVSAASSARDERGRMETSGGGDWGRYRHLTPSISKGQGVRSVGAATHRTPGPRLDAAIRHWSIRGMRAVDPTGHTDPRQVPPHGPQQPQIAAPAGNRPAHRVCPKVAHRPLLLRAVEPRSAQPLPPRPVHRRLRLRARRSGRREARVLLGSANGAQRASLRDSKVPSASRSRSLVTAFVAAALLGALIAAPASASVRTTVRVPDQMAPQITVPPGYWWPEENYYLSLVNCTRTGGWVQTNGTCKGYGSGRYSTYVAPLKYHQRISGVVSRPYARLLAMRNQCSHFYTSTPPMRFAAAGYRPSNWAENIGCRTSRYATPAVLASHLFFQAEKSTGGGHWRNIKNPRLHQIGIGVWKNGSIVRLVTDFVA